jgi:Protein of unknown function (DUF2690)
MLRRRAPKNVLAVVIAIGSMAGLGIVTPGTAIAETHAATSRMILLTPQLTCSYARASRVRSASWVNGNETRIVYLWYSNSTACAWAVEVNGQPGDEVWVYNVNTGAEAKAYIASGQHSATTGEVGDSGTKSKACMLPHLANGTTGPKTCTTTY